MQKHTYSGGPASGAGGGCAAGRGGGCGGAAGRGVRCGRAKGALRQSGGGAAAAHKVRCGSAGAAGPHRGGHGGGQIWRLACASGQCEGVLGGAQCPIDDGADLQVNGPGKAGGRGDDDGVPLDVGVAGGIDVGVVCLAEAGLAELRGIELVRVG
jgi:hypothetical protein